MYEKSSVLLAGNWRQEYGSVAYVFSPIKIHFSDQPKSLISRINKFMYISITYFIGNKKYLLKMIYDEVREDIFDTSNVRMVKESDKKKMGMFILCYVFGQLSSVKRLA